MPTEAKRSRLQKAIEKLDEAESKLKRHAQDIERKDMAALSPEDKDDLAALAAAADAVAAARALLRQMEEEAGAAGVSAD